MPGSLLSLPAFELDWKSSASGCGKARWADGYSGSAVCELQRTGSRNPKLWAPGAAPAYRPPAGDALPSVHSRDLDMRVSVFNLLHSQE